MTQSRNSQGEICGDIPLSSREKVYYFFSNFLRNLQGIRIPPATIAWHTRLKDSSSGSVGRAYMNAFLEEKLSTFLLKKEISVLDIGCGLCHIRGILARQGFSGTYTGIDIVREPLLDTELVPAFLTTFREGDFLTEDIQGPFSLVISNTALEHIYDDRVVVHKAHRACSPEGVEVHIVPSHWSLFLYFSQSRFEVYRLGGFASFLLHFFAVTIPERILGRFFVRKTRAYVSLKRVCNKIDRFLPFCPIAYAVVVFHH